MSVGAPLVETEQDRSIRVEDLPEPKDAAATQAKLTWRKDGGAVHTQLVPVGRDVPLSIPIDHGGPNIVELEVEYAPIPMDPFREPPGAQSTPKVDRS